VRGKGAFTSLELDRLAEEVQTPAEYVMESAHEGTEPRERSFFRISPATVHMTALKRAEQGDGLVVRLQERAGRPAKFTLESSLLGLRHEGQIQPWELKTLSVTGAKGRRQEVKEVSILER
jgi:alpha-mannosidase